MFIYRKLAALVLAARPRDFDRVGTMAKYRILVVDDEQDIRDVTCLLLGKSGYEAISIDGAQAALDAMEKEPYDLVLTDMLMPDMDGVELITEIRRRDPAQVIVAMSGGGHAPKESYLQIAKLYGVQGVLSKPFNQEKLFEALIECGAPRNEV